MAGRIGIREYINVLDRVAGNKKGMCPYCQHETIAFTDTWACSHCEAGISNALVAPALNDEILMSTLDKVNAALNANDYQTAITEYQKILKTYTDPAFMYYYGILHIAYSNSEVEKIRYDLPGFMEDNSKHREFASKLISKAKLIFNEGLVAGQKEIEQGNITPWLLFNMFMIHIKLHNYKSAKRITTDLEKRNNEYLTEYSKMVLSVYIDDYANAVEHANNLLSSKYLSINAFYYVAFTLFKNRKYKEANEILTHLTKYMQSSSVNALMREIEVINSL